MAQTQHAGENALCSVGKTIFHEPSAIEVRGARVHNLKDIDVDIPLHCMVGIAGVSGSGKSSLALGVLYAEGSRRYLEALSTYTRRRISQTTRAQVNEVLHVPAAIALRQRPATPGVHSTFGTSTELLNYLRLMFSRLGSHECPNGHHVPPSLNVAAEKPLECPVCHEKFYGPSAEDLAFNSGGACPTCGGTGVVREIDESTLISDDSLTLEEGAVAPWRQLMWSLMPQVAQEMGVRIDVPYRDLTDHEKDIVLHGPMEKKHILYVPKNKSHATELDFTYYSAENTVRNALAKVKDEKGLARVARFLKQGTCPDCHGTRLSKKARSSLLDGRNLADATAQTLDELATWVPTIPGTLPEEMRPMAEAIISEMGEPVQRLQQLGLGYLSLDRAGATLSNGELQRVQLARAVRTRTTGVLYVLDEPSIGLHPSNVEGLLGVIDDLMGDGNSVVVVDHDLRVLKATDWLVEIGPGSGADGGRVIAQGTVGQVEDNPASRIGPYLSGAKSVHGRERANDNELFAKGAIGLETGPLHTVKSLSVRLPIGRMTAITGVSGSGKTTLILESLIPALRAALDDGKLPPHVRKVEAGPIKRVHLIDATPIGANVRSTVATYSGIMDDLRRAFAATPAAKERGLKAGDFSYNTGKLRCPTCDGTGQISLDVQFLPDVDIPCPDCHGSRYDEEAYEVRLPLRDAQGCLDGASEKANATTDSTDEFALPDVLALTVDELLCMATDAVKKAKTKLQTLSDLGLGYLTLGEATPALSGGEAQRLKLAGEMHKRQEDALFVFDEPTIGLHPADVEVLLRVLQRLVDKGATVVVIEHDLDLISNSDYVIDMGPGGGEAGGTIVAAGTPEHIVACTDSVTGKYLKPLV
ncbi:MAG: excinuclease ABC subunit UvrA [Coriobacteriales bacterium]